MTRILILLFLAGMMFSCGRSETHEKLIGKWRVVNCVYNKPGDPDNALNNAFNNNELMGLITEFTADQYKLRPEWNEYKPYSFNTSDNTVEFENSDHVIKVKTVTDTELITQEGRNGEFYLTMYYERLPE